MNTRCLYGSMPYFMVSALMSVFSVQCFAAEFMNPILQNTGFEKGGDGWTMPDSTGWRIVKGRGRDGSMALEWRGAQGQGPSQRLALHSGVRYRFGAWVRFDRPVRNLDGAGPKIALRWFDWQEKQRGETVAAPVVDNNPRTDGWIRYEGFTPPIAGPYGDLTVEMPDGAKGRVLLDDFNLFAEIGDPVGALISSAYRDEAVEGRVKFSVALNINTVTHPLDKLAPSFVFEGAGGRRSVRKPDVFSLDKAEVTVDVSSLASGTSQVGFELRTVDGKTVGKAFLRFSRPAALPKRRVYFDAYNRTIVDGKPFFPLGMFAGSLTDESVKLYTQGPFNCIMSYRANAKTVELCGKTGLKLISNIKDMVPGSPWMKQLGKTKEEAMEMIRSAVERDRRHPSILAWYICDEAPIKQVPLLSEVRDLVHSVDPDHPAYIVLDRPEHVRAFTPVFDVIGMDPYPIGNNRGGIDIAYSWAATANDGMYGSRPMWHVPQAYSWGWNAGRRKAAGDDPDLRFPTREEFSSMIWQAVAAGANGIIPYAFHSMCRQTKGAEFDAIWKIVCGSMAEMKAQESILLAKPGPKVADVPAGLVVRTYRTDDGAVHVLVCNTSRSPVNAKLKIGGRLRSPVCKVGGGASSSRPGVLSLKMPPIGVVLATMKE